MLHACVERFNVTDTVRKILGTKRGLCRAQWHQCGKSLLDLVPAPGDAWADRHRNAEMAARFLQGLCIALRQCSDPTTGQEAVTCNRNGLDANSTWFPKFYFKTCQSLF